MFAQPYHSRSFPLASVHRRCVAATFGNSANGDQRFGSHCFRFMHPPTKESPGESVKVPVWAILDTMLLPGVPTTIPSTTGTLFRSGPGPLKVRCADVGTTEEDVQPSNNQII
jgi:hypothetical protein